MMKKRYPAVVVQQCIFSCILTIIMICNARAEFEKSTSGSTSIDQTVVLPESKQNSVALKDSSNENKKSGETEQINGEEIFILQNFEVSEERDRGYYSANALAGTRTNQLIKDTPMTITVVNQEMLNDMNMTEIDSLSAVVVSANSEGESYSNRLLRFRGLLTRFQLFEFMPRQGPQNSYNVDRVEVVRGANSLVYGQAAPGGKANFLSKKALFFNDFNKLELEVGSNELFRSLTDSNLEINELLALRFITTHQEKEFSQDYKSNRFNGMTAAVAFRPSNRTSVNLHAEYFDEERNNPKGVYKDKTSNYGLTGILENLPVTPDIIKYLSDDAMQSMIDYNDGTLQSPNNITPQLNINSADDLRRFYSSITSENSGTISGPDVGQSREGFFLMGDISHRITDDLSVKLALMHEDLDGKNLIRANATDVYLSARNKGNLRDPEKEPNDIDPNDPSDAGKMPSPYMTPFWQMSHTSDNTDSIRTTFSWDKELLGTQQQFLFGLDYDRRNSNETQYQELWDGSIINADGSWSGADRAKDYLLLNDIHNGYLAGLSYDFLTYLSKNFNGEANMGAGRDPIKDIAGASSFFALQRTRTSEVQTKALWMAAQGRYMNNRLNTLVGLRFDSIDLKANTRNWQGGAASNLNEDYFEVSPSLGALFWLNKNLGFFANYAESIESPNGWALDPLGNSVPPELGTGFEYGLKFEFLDGLISGQLIGYHVTKQNDILNKLTNAQLERLYPDDRYDFLYDNSSGQFSPLGRNVPGLKTRSQGVELDFYYNPTKDISVFLGYAYVDAAFQDAPIDEKTGDSIVMNGERVPGTTQHNLNLTTRYSFSDGRLKGCYLGSNIKYRSKSYYNRLYADIGSDGNGVGENHYDGIPDVVPLVDENGELYAGGDPVSYELWLADNIETTVFFGWRGQLKRGQNHPKYSLQVSVANLFDRRDLIASGNNARYTEGRRLSIKASVQF